MACRDSKSIATLKPCENSNTEHKSSVPLRALLLVANAEHSIFNKQFIVFCISPWHSTSGTEAASSIYVYKFNVCHRGWSYNHEKSVREWTALLVGVVMLLDHIPSDWKYQCPENNQMNLYLANCKIYSSNIQSICCHEFYFWKWCKILREV